MPFNRYCSTEKKVFVKYLRKHLTPAENFAWQRLRKQQLALGLKFHRQVLIAGFIVDFWCPAIKLVVEIDGKIHDSIKEQDELKNTVLTNLGLKVLRFTNNEVFYDWNTVKDTILVFANEKRWKVKKKRVTPKREKLNT